MKIEKTPERSLLFFFGREGNPPRSDSEPGCYTQNTRSYFTHTLRFPQYLRQTKCTMFPAP